MKPPLRQALAASALAATVAACVPDTSSLTPLPRQFHFPVAGAVSADSHYLYVVNSDFNLEFNSARVQVVDLERVRARIDQLRGQNSLPLPAVQYEALRCPTADGCEAEWLVPTSGASVTINPYATHASLRADGRRLYIAVRGDGSLTWLDINSNGWGLSCGAGSAEGLCDNVHRPGPNAMFTGSDRSLTLPALPVAMDATGADGFIAIAHQEDPRGRVSLYWDSGAGPVLTHWVWDFSPRLWGIARVDDGRAMRSAQPHWYALSRYEPFFNHVRAVPNGAHSYLYRGDLVSMQGVAPDVGLRAMVRSQCDPNTAVATARPRPPDAAVPYTRSSDQLLRIDLTNVDDPRVIDAQNLPLGASNLAVYPPGNQHCDGPQLAYVVSYDARRLYVVDLRTFQVVDQLRTQSGPHVPLVDPQAGDGVHDYLYLIDFAAMVIEVVDVRPGSPTRHQVLFTIGDVVRPREFQ